MFLAFAIKTIRFCDHRQTIFNKIYFLNQLSFNEENQKNKCMLKLKDLERELLRWRKWGLEQQTSLVLVLVSLYWNRCRQIYQNIFKTIEIRIQMTEPASF